MQRDFHLLRDIVLCVAKGDDPLHYVRGWNREEIDWHCRLLNEAGLLAGEVVRPLNGVQEFCTAGLTWDGLEFVDLARDQELWWSVSAKLDAAGGSAFSVLLDLLQAEHVKRFSAAIS